jgi:hypothetical protein
MLRASRLILLGIVPILFGGGCSRLPRQSGAPLIATQMAPDIVTLDVVWVRFPLGDAEINGSLWTDIDEQQFPVELRRRLTANGIRAGVIGTRIPVKLEQLLKLSGEAPSPDAESEPVDLENEPTVRRRLLQMGSGKRTHIVCTGDRMRHAALSVLIRGDDGQVNGRTYQKAMGILATKAFPQGDGRVRLELMPELEYGDAQRRFDPGEGVLKVEFSPPREKFDLLRMETTLSPGQMLILTTIPDRPGSLGYQYFTEQTTDRTEQKLLLVRLSQTQYDDLFSADPLAPSAE